MRICPAELRHESTCGFTPGLSSHMPLSVGMFAMSVTNSYARNLHLHTKIVSFCGSFSLVRRLYCVQEHNLGPNSCFHSDSG